MIYQGYTGNTEHSKHIEHILLVTNANNRHQLSPHRKFQNHEISLCQFRQLRNVQTMLMIVVMKTSN